MTLVYTISGYNPITDELESVFVVPNELTERILEVVGNDYDGVSDYSLSTLTLDSIYYALSKSGFKINDDLDYSIGPVN
jgi:hypothetical protein